MQLFDALLHTPVDCKLQSIDLSYFLEENLAIVLQVVGKRDLVPLVTDPALRCVYPKRPFFDLIVPQDSRKDDFIHVTGHRILNKLIVGYLIDAHKHERQLTSRTILVFLDD